MKKKYLTEYPHLIKGIHPTKNSGIDISKITHGSNVNFWWVCQKNSIHEWYTSVRYRIRDKSDCPYCVNQKVSPENSIYFTHPEISKEWHPTKNGNLTPDKVSSGSGRKVYWICPEGHQPYKSSVLTRVCSKGCPKCSHIERGKGNYKPVVQMDQQGNDIKEFESIGKAAIELEVYQGNISLVLNGTIKSTGGFKFRYA